MGERLTAIFGAFNGVTEAEEFSLGIGLILGIAALFIAANAARPKR